MTREKPIAWQPLPDITTPCAGVVLKTGPGETTVRLLFSQMVGGPNRDLLVHFEQGTLAAMCHEEFVDPWNTPEGAAAYRALPRVGGSFTYPMVEVQDSEWLASFPDSHILDDQRRVAKHFRFLSLDNSVDVLTLSPPTAAWVPAEK